MQLRTRYEGPWVWPAYREGCCISLSHILAPCMHMAMQGALETQVHAQEQEASVCVMWIIYSLHSSYYVASIPRQVQSPWATCGSISGTAPKAQSAPRMEFSTRTQLALS